MGISGKQKSLYILLWVVLTQVCAHIKFIDLYTQTKHSLSTLIYAMLYLNLKNHMQAADWDSR